MEIEVGRVYRVDHSNCPTTTSLATIRAVLVSKKSEDDVTVVFPSTKSLDDFFGRNKSSGSLLQQPSMDEEFVMDLKLGTNILTHKISSDDFAAQRGAKHFWISTNSNNDNNNNNNNNNISQEHDHDHKSSSSVELGVQWETRRRTRFYTRRKLNTVVNHKIINATTNKAAVKLDDVDDRQAVDSMEVCRPQDEGVSINSKEEVKEEDVKPKPRSVGKRKCQFKGVTYCDKRKKRKPTQAVSQKKFIDPQHRWTVERYKLAETNMLKIMKEKGAGPNNPIRRPDLRAEARKLIGDTGLLDHLLKHMAGKLAPGGKERFCRRHNPEGAMEYWMESADLVQVRKREGIADPFWVPPPGWKPGDCPTHDPLCALQLKELREEIWSMKREIGKLSSRRGKENSEVLAADRPAKPEKSAERLNFEESLQPLREMYEEVMKKKATVEKQLLDICRSYSGMEGEIVKLKEAAACSEATSENDETRARGMSASDIEEKGKEGRQDDQKSGDTKEKVKSGFRMCKPQGTFLWPSQQLASSHSQLLLMPPRDDTQHHRQPQSHRLCPVAKPMATRAGVTLSFSTATIRGATTIHSIDSPTACSPTSLHYYIPDLNHAPIYSLPPLHH